jgi:hypothetical protein
MRRRDFVKSAATTVGGSLLGVSLNQAAGLTSPEASASGSTNELKSDEVPDTLDLADRAALSINALTGAADPERNYETYLSGHLVFRPPNMSGLSGMCAAKPVHALPCLRVMSGSKLRSDYDYKMLEACTRDVEKDGLWWLNVEGRPWRAKSLGQPGGTEGGRDIVCVQGQARLMVALMDCWSKYDPDPRWLDLVQRMSDGLAQIALRNDDLAWYHYIYSRSGWSGKLDPDANPDPTGAGGGGFIYTDGHPLRAFSRWYAVSGDKKALDMADRLARFLMRPEVWGTGEGPTMVDASAHGLWRGHFHSHTMGMKGLLEYGIVTRDARVQEFVADFYEYSRNFGIPRMGWFPNFIGPIQEVQENAFNSWGSKAMMMEGCDIGDMTWLAVRLSDAGIGDHWDDVDQWVRNHLVEHQMINREILEDIVTSSPEHKTNTLTETDDNIIARNIGSFLSSSDPTIGEPWWTMCCNANCALGGLYSAWKSIVQGTGDVARVNLLLNRTSPWLDVDSYLPYEGKVVLRNKTARKAYVRLPRWIDKKAVRCHVNQAEVVAAWLDNYVTFQGLASRDVITINFPLVETTEKYTELLSGQEYTCRFKGNTLVDISPRAKLPGRPRGISDAGSRFSFTKAYPMYQRDFYNRPTAPLKRRPQYVSSMVI